MTLKEKWDNVIKKLSEKFSPGEEISLEGVLFLIGVQELSLGIKKFSKSEKQDLMHVAICTILEPFGYYKKEGTDDQGWPQFQSLKKLPPLRKGEQSRILKEGIILYFKEKS
jgi:hypothetical protein